jgi:hypothetical protein
MLFYVHMVKCTGLPGKYRCQQRLGHPTTPSTDGGHIRSKRREVKNDALRIWI